MKRLLTSICLIFISTLCFSKNIEPRLKLEVHFVESKDTLFLKSLRSSQETCCKYEIITVKSHENKIIVCNENSSIGTIYGYPTERFLLDIYDRVFKSK